MESVNEMFLQALCAFLQKKTVDWVDAQTPETWHRLFSVAAAHRVLPMIYEATVRSPSAQKADPQIFMAVKKQTMQVVILQTIKTNAFLKLLSELVSAGVTPLVVKGIICRELYPNPDYRISGDEDVLIPEVQFALCHETMLACGMELADPTVNLDYYETSYMQQNGGLYIELHRQLFPTEWDVLGDYNHFFEGVHERAETQNIQGISVPTMNPTDHLFYLICHAFKHFMNCGFGIRQVCDICLYANTFGEQIEWQKIQLQCEEIHADLFAVALFRIGEKYLTFQPEMACYPAQWRTLEVDETAMLADILDSGVYGKSSMSRLHSGNITLHAVSDRKQEKKSGNSVLRTIFPPAKHLYGAYSYLKEKPYLLPVAWAHRIVRYSRETASAESGNNALESIKIGKKRIELLKQYGIIEQ